MQDSKTTESSLHEKIDKDVSILEMPEKDKEAFALWLKHLDLPLKQFTRFIYPSNERPVSSFQTTVRRPYRKSGGQKTTSYIYLFLEIMKTVHSNWQEAINKATEGMSQEEFRIFKEDLGGLYDMPLKAFDSTISHTLLDHGEK